MRFVALALILISLPLFIGLLKQHRNRRDWALIALGAMLFFGGSLQIDAALITWPLWPGTARGVLISPVDTLAAALILTRKNKVKNLPFLGIFAFYAATLLLSTISSSVPMATFFAVFSCIRVVLLFVAIGGECDRPQAGRNLMIGLSLGLILQAGHVIAQKLDGIVQATGTLEHQNVLGMMTELALLPLIAAVLDGNRNKLNYVGIAAGFIIIAGGGSRGAMGVMVVSTILLTILSLIRRPSSRKLKIVGLGLLGMAIAVPVGLGTLEDRFGDKTFVTEETERAAFERAAKAISDDYPFGIGANLFVNVANVQGYSERAGVAWNQANRSAPVHNAYLLARAETGRLGELAFLLLFAVSAIQGLRIVFARRSEQAGGMALGSAVALLAIIFHSFFEYAAHLYYTQTLIVVNMAIISAYIRSSKLVKNSKARQSKVDRTAQHIHANSPA